MASFLHEQKPHVTTNLQRQTHLNSFFSSWTEDTCIFKLHFNEKVEQQMLHLKGISPSWTKILDASQLIEQLDQLSEVEKHIIVQYYFWTGMKIFKKNWQCALRSQAGEWVVSEWGLAGDLIYLEHKITFSDGFARV